MRRLAARWLQSWKFLTEKGLPFRVELTDRGEICVGGFSRSALPIDNIWERPAECEPPQIAKMLFLG